jgi:hypothetical protein
VHEFHQLLRILLDRGARTQLPPALLISIHNEKFPLGLLMYMV